MSTLPEGGAVPFNLHISLPRSGGLKFIPVLVGNNNLGTVLISDGPNIVGSAMDSAQRAFTTAGGIAILVSLFVGLVISSKLSAPITRLTRVVEKMQKGDLSARSSAPGKDEIGLLSSQFNQLADQLERSFSELKTERDTLRRFVADASHELRTPVSALQMFTELLENVDDEDPAERQAILSDCQTEVSRLAWIINNLLDLSRMDAGIVDLTYEQCSVYELLIGAVNELKSKAREKGVHLVCPNPAPGVVLNCDRARMQIALANLLDNAVKYSPSGGTVAAGAEILPEEICFYVQDSGPGIPAEVLPYVFDRFFRGKDRSVTGSGLGLAIVKSIVELHNGETFIYSQPGNGTRVELRLPLFKSFPEVHP